MAKNKSEGKATTVAPPAAATPTAPMTVTAPSAATHIDASHAAATHNAKALVLAALAAALRSSGILPAGVDVSIEATVNAANARAQRGDVSSSLPLRVASVLKNPKSAPEHALTLVRHLEEHNKAAAADAKFEKVRQGCVCDMCGSVRLCMRMQTNLRDCGGHGGA